ncbi:LacI family transcriptional regulator [Mycobacterium sp. 21AC1]|uniref:LacI family DNA-binding transcriptional regulator n=1 Tax=[Mycobacterium] appelbergii TaxID=2939269 RepID=UPI002938F56B|nr:LacI family DNA-binding transcriptional regulator [Mycobacterium sp. 21AC1]MDV3126147.1 LacI family transcriptional regulator [Mycobacterium sp. 21AC1]
MSTLADVAKLAGVGVGTASRALSGKGYVDEATKSRVQTAAAKLKYRGNAAARALRERRSRAIGLLIPDLSNEFYTSAAEVLQVELDAAGFQLIVAQTGGAAGDEQRAWETMLSRQVDGVVHVPVDPLGSVPTTLPVVQLNRRSQRCTATAVLSHDAQGVQLLTEHLIDVGHRDIVALVGPSDFSTTKDRLAGFRSAIAAADIPEVPAGTHDRAQPRTRVLSAALTIDAGAAAIESIADDLPTAVLALSAQFVLGTLAVCKRRSIDIPTELSIAGFNDPAWYSVWNPAITTFAPPLADMGRRASREILAAIDTWDGRPAKRPAVIQMEGELRIRDSVAAITHQSRRRPVPSSR